MKKFRIEDVLNGLKPIYSLKVSKYRILQVKFLISDNVFLNVIGMIMETVFIITVLITVLIFIVLGLFL